MEKQYQIRAAVGMSVAIAAVLVLSFAPYGVLLSAVSGFTQINLMLVSLGLAAGFGALMAWFWPKIKLAHQALITLAFLSIGIFLGFPAFTALALTGLVLWVMVKNNKKGAM